MLQSWHAPIAPLTQRLLYPCHVLLLVLTVTFLIVLS